MQIINNDGLPSSITDLYIVYPFNRFINDNILSFIVCSLFRRIDGHSERGLFSTSLYSNVALVGDFINRRCHSGRDDYQMSARYSIQWDYIGNLKIHTKRRCESFLKHNCYDIFIDDIGQLFRYQVIYETNGKCNTCSTGVGVWSEDLTSLRNI